MSQVMIDDELITGIANSIRKMRKINYPITTDSFAGEIEQIDIGYDVNDTTWQRPLSWPDYSRINLTGFEGMYFTYDTTVPGGWCGINANASGGFTIQRGQIVDGEFISETSTDVGSGSTFFEWLPYTITGYVVYKVTAKTAGTAITRIGMSSRTTTVSGDGTQDIYQNQPCIERYGRLPRITSLYQWPVFTLVSDTIRDLAELTSLSGVWYQCNNIINIDLSGFSSRVTTLYYTFRNCPNLEYLKVDGPLCTSACTSMNCTFYLCTSLYFIDTTNWDTSNVVSFASTFYECRKLTKLDVSNFNTAKATNMSNMFGYCNRLKELDVSNFDTHLVTAFNSMFAQCYNLESLDVSSFNTSAATTMNYMFAYMYTIKSIDVSNFVTTNVTTMAYMFYQDRALEQLDLHHFNMGKITDIQYMFSGCYGLKSLDIHGWNMPLLTTSRSFAESCWNIENFNTTDTIVGSAEDNPFKIANCFASPFSSMYRVRKIDLSGWNLGDLPAVYSAIFRYDYQIEEIIMLASFKQIGSTSFDGCRNLKKLVLPRTSVVVLDNVNAFGTTPATKVIYVPDNLISSYQTANVWKNLTGVTFAGLSELTN